MALAPRFDELHAQASQASGGLSDFGDRAYEDALRLLLRDYDRNAGLDATGEQFIAATIVGDLRARLLEEHGFRAHPDLADAPIRKPLVIVGMARTGTTVLQRLIGADPDIQSLPLWLSYNPMPRPPRDTWESRADYQQVVQALAQLHVMAPQFSRIHPQSADAPDEDRMLLAHEFVAPNYAMTARLPEYTERVKADDGQLSYRRYRRALGLIGGGSDKRWLLKCPTHLWKLPTLLSGIPDACLIVTHRDPAESMTSIISLVLELMRMISPATDARQFARDYLDLWAWVLNKAERDREGISPARIIDLHCDDIRRDPVGSVERIYRHFDIPVTDAARACWQRRATEAPEGGHSPHRYRPEDFGLTARAIRDATRPHYERYLAVAAARA